MKNILELSADEVKEFFLKSESYFNADLPLYFNFNNLLSKVNDVLSNSNLSDFFKEKPWNYDDINYHLFSNKDGKYSWRPFQIINPAIYVEMVNIITDNDNWEYIKNQFQKFQSPKNIKCVSIPVQSTCKKKDKAVQILTWWEKIEQESLKLALKYNYVIHTDITNCYGNIYTHTISWALHGKETAKIERGNNKLLGNRLDKIFQSMNYGQTNGIPQGSILSDFIAEIILGYVDLKLYETIEKNNIKDYEILRYRDDYRIFTKELTIGEKILKLLSEILLEFNFKLNDKKTFVENDLILSALKKDKVQFIGLNRFSLSIQEELLMLYKFSIDYPNSGTLAKWLKRIYEKLDKNKYDLKKSDKIVLISILVEIMYKNPKVIPPCIAVISIFVKYLSENEQKEIFENIINKFSTIPNIGLLEIWLQRLIVPFGVNDLSNKFNDKLCKKVENSEYEIWNIDWLSGNLHDIIKKTDIIERNKLSKLNKIIEENEFDIFSYPHF
jgi:RNA-directed DNA polymerase